MPTGTPVDRCDQKVKAEGRAVNAAAVCQASTGQSLATGKKLCECSHCKAKAFRERARKIVGKFSEGDGYRIPKCWAFKAGTHRGKPYSESDLDDMAENFRKYQSGEGALMKVPQVWGHEEEDLQRSDMPSYAWASKVERDGPHLYVDWDGVDPEAARLIKEGKYATVSAEIYDEDTMPVELKEAGAKGKVLRRVAFLGGEQPQIKGSQNRIPMPVKNTEGGRQYERLSFICVGGQCVRVDTFAESKPAKYCGGEGGKKGPCSEGGAKEPSRRKPEEAAAAHANGAYRTAVQKGHTHEQAMKIGRAAGVAARDAHKQGKDAADAERRAGIAAARATGGLYGHNYKPHAEGTEAFSAKNWAEGDMNHDEMIQALTEMGFQPEALDGASDELLAEILRVYTEEEAGEPAKEGEIEKTLPADESSGKIDKTLPAEHDEKVVPQSTEGLVGGKEKFEELPHEEVAKMPDKEARQYLERYADHMRRKFEEIEAAKPTPKAPAPPAEVQNPGDISVHPKSVSYSMKYSEQDRAKIASLVTETVKPLVEALRKEFTPIRQDVEKFREETATDKKRARVQNLIAELRRSNRLAPAETDTSDGLPSLEDELMLLDDRRGVHKFSEGTGKARRVVELTQLDIQERKLLGRKPHCFKEKLPNPAPGKGSKASEDAEVEAIKEHYESFAEDFRRVGTTEEEIVNAFKAKQKREPGLTAQDFLNRPHAGRRAS